MLDLIKNLELLFYGRILRRCYRPEIDWDKYMQTKYPTKDYIYNTERTLKIQQ